MWVDVWNTESLGQLGSSMPWLVGRYPWVHPVPWRAGQVSLIRISKYAVKKWERMRSRMIHALWKDAERKKSR